VPRPRPARRFSARVALAGAALLAAGAGSLAGAPAAFADGPTVTGAGSTFSQVALDVWRADVKARYGLTINYNGNGSSAGRNFYIQNSVDFAGSEIPFEPDENNRLKGNRSYLYSPVVAGATSLMYNVVDANGQGVTDLQLSPPTIAGIFTGNILKWDDPAITKDNGGQVVSTDEITPVVRSDGSGTSAQFTAFMANQVGDTWRPFAQKYGAKPDGNESQYPTGWGRVVAQNGSDGVANYVANRGQGRGSVTYVETAYAINRDFPVASVLNKAGKFTQPSSANVSTALTTATLNADRTQNLGAVYTNPDPNTYPISSYSYIIVQGDGFDPAKGKVLSQFMIYFACAGQQKASVLGYAPLPPNLVSTVFDVINNIPGHVTPPDLSKCPNPTIPGAVDGGLPGTGDSGTGVAAAPVTDRAVARTAGTSATAVKGKVTRGSRPGTAGTAPGAPVVIAGTPVGPAPGTAGTAAGGAPAPGALPPGAAGPLGTAAGAPPGAAVDPALAAVTGGAAAGVPDPVTGVPAAGAQTVAYAADQPVSVTVRGSGAGAALPALLLLAILVLPPLLWAPVQSLRRRGLRRSSGAAA